MSEEIKKKPMNKLIPLAVGAIVIAGGAFFGGMQYADHANAAMRQGRFQQMGTAGGAGFVRGAGGAAGARGGAGFVVGEILSKDDKSITVKTQDGGSKTVYLSATTQVMKSDAGATSDLAVGQSVTTMGTANSDGSVTATSVQIRPAMPAKPAAQPIPQP